MIDSSDEIEQLARRASAGDIGAMARAFEHFRDRLKQSVRMRLDSRVSGRLDPSDVVQEAFLDAMRRFPEFVAGNDVGLFRWLRFLTEQRLVDLHRQHLAAQMRAAGVETSLDRPARPNVSSVWLAAQLVDQQQSPSSAFLRRELRASLEGILEGMDPLDREVLAMRHFELLTNREVAETLGLTKSAASNRYIRALKRLKDILDPPESTSRGRT